MGLMRRLVFVLIFSVALIANEELAVRRIGAHLLIRDRRAALIEVKNALTHYPESKKLQALLIQAVSENGEEQEALTLWRRYFNDEENHLLLETLAWGVLFKGENAAGLQGRYLTLVGSFFTRDARAVALIHRGMQSTNALLRAISVKMATFYRDDLLKDEIKRLIHEEKSFHVRFELIDAIGKLGMHELEGELLEILNDQRSSVEEKALAIQATSRLCDQIDSAHVNKLLSSERIYLRMLGCELLSHFELNNRVELLCSRLTDPSLDVRLYALAALALCDSSELTDATTHIEKMTRDNHPILSISAAQILLRFHKETNEALLANWLYSSSREFRLLAAGALRNAGAFGETLMREALEKSDDPFVRLNSALGLIGLRQNVEGACAEIFAFLKETREKIMIDQMSHPLFAMIVPSRVRHIPHMPRYPDLIDQQTRLTLLGLLAALRFERAEEAVKSFLLSHFSQLSSSAAALLLQEGSPEMLDLVTGLLDDRDPRLRLQAALALAFLGGDPKALDVIHGSYSAANRDEKLMLLEAISHVGSLTSLPLLINALDEPFQILRMAAASAIIQCLNH